MNLIEAKCELQDRNPPKVPFEWFIVEITLAIVVVELLVQVLV